VKRLSNVLVPVFALSLLMSGPALGQARLPEQHPGRDITDTPAGEHAARAAVARWAAQGVRIAAHDVTVRDLGAEGLLVAPEDAVDLAMTASGIGTDSPSMSTSVTVGHRLQAPGGVAMAAEGDVQVAAAAYWSWREGLCFSRKWVDSAWLDSCYEINRLINDGSSTVDFYSLEHWAYIGETQFGLRHAWVEGWRASGSPWQSWYRASPGTDSSGFCRDISVTATVLSATVGSTFQACEGWDITKSANGSDVRMKNQWQCNCSFMIGGNRETAYTIVITVPAGQYPRWTLGWGMAA
jgi:hypothetical protein